MNPRPPGGALPLREAGEFAHDALVDRAFERHDEVGQPLDRLPFPGDEFGVVGAAAGGRDVDLAIITGEAQCKPLLGLAAVFAAPGPADDFARDVVGEPVRDFTEPLDRTDAGLLVEFAQARRPWVFAGIDAALRHLPDMGLVDVLGPLGTAADEDEAGRIDDRKP